MSIKLSLILLSIILLAGFVGLQANSDTPANTSAKSVFIDLDGDGFDDGLDDQNADGIPDDVKKSPVVESSTEKETSFFAGVKTIGVQTPVFIRNSGSFNYLKRALLPLTQHRGGFNSGSEFGPGGDIGSGAVLGGPCSGGACCP